MSRRRSTGDLVPKDITEILAREARAQRGQRKPGSSLGQAFSWLRGSRRKKNLGNGLKRDPAAVAENKLGLQNHEAVKAGPKGNEDQKRLAVHYTASQHHQENVFIQGTRPQYLEDLHTEAQEGLKIQQQEDHKNGGTFADDESIASTDSLCPEQHISSKDRDSSLESRSTGTPDTTVTSAVSTEPALTRQGSTFKPLNPVKRTDRSRRRNRRTTIMGIPNQVQKELALHRGSTFQPLVSTQLPDHDKPDSQSSVVIIPTVDGGTPVANKEGARVHLSELEVFRDEALVREHLQGVYQNQKSYLCPTSYLRPKSVAVPGITTSFSLSSSMQEPQGPVMSISPQATYMSTIIPNAILPASVEVIEIDHSISRTRGGSVNHDGGACTISKNSLTHGDSAVSPLLSRRSEGDGSQTNSSNYYTTLMEPNWSQSQSSKTVSSNKAGLNLQGSKVEQSKDQVLASLQSSVSATSSPSSKAEDATDSSSDCGATNAMTAGEQIKNKRSATHSLSVMKTKQPPAPPQRTNSLHSNKIRGDSKTVETKDVSNSGSKEEAEDITRLVVTNISTTLTPLSKSSLGEPSLQDSSKHNRKAIEPPLESSTSSPQKNPPEGEHFERTMSPSSGYSSQSGTPTLSPKGISSASPDQQKNTPRKPERSASRASSSAASPSSSLTSLSSDTSELANSSVSTCSTTLLQQRSSPPVTTEELPPVNEPSSFRVSVRELFNIPPPPKVKAPCPPPPETWAHNKRTVELLCRTCTNREVPQKPTQIQDRTEEQTEIQMKPRDDLQIKEEKQTATEECVQETSGKNTKLVAFSPMESQSGDVEQEIRERSGPQQVQEEEKTDVQREERNTSEDKEPEIQATTPKKNPPPVMKKPPRLLFMEDEEQLLEADTEGTEVHVSVEKHKESSHNTVSIVVQERDEVPSMQMLSVEGPKTHKLSPPPTPPPAYQPTPPLMKKTSSTAECVAPKEPQREQEDPCWPPPPPPMEGDSVFDGGEEVDFPPPPPPSITDSVLEVTDVGVSRAETADEAAWKPVQNISCIADSVSLPSVEPSPVSPRAESPVSVTAVVLPSSVLKQNPLKSEEPSPSAHPESAQLSAPGTLLTAETSTQGFPFRRLSSGGFRDTRSKELLPRHKVPPNPKEDANIPLVTPSLLQMVRLRSVSMNEDQVKAASEDKSINLEALVQENCPVSIQGPQNIPQKPIRKSLSLKSSTQTLQTSVVTTNSPSTCLQEVIRMKTAAMSSRDGLTPRLGVKPPAYSCTSEPGALKSHEEMHRSTASTASFIFSRSTKKVVIETVAASSSEAQASLKQNLAAELRQVSDQSKPGAYANGGLKCDKVPPPVAKKPAHGSMSPSQRSHGPSVKVELHTERNGTRGGVQYPSRVAPPETTTRVTVDTIETLF